MCEFQCRLGPLHDQNILAAEDYQLHCEVITLSSDNLRVKLMSMWHFYLPCKFWTFANKVILQGMVEHCGDLIWRQWVTAGKELIGHWKKWKGRDLYCVHESSLSTPTPQPNCLFLSCRLEIFTELHFLCWKDSFSHKNWMQTLTSKLFVNNIMSQICRCITTNIQWLLKRNPRYKYMCLIITMPC